jgi:Ni,Fe-hydrogenase III component G
MSITIIFFLSTYVNYEIADMLGFLRLRAWDARREQEKKKPRQRFIDEVWPGLKPG